MVPEPLIWETSALVEFFKRKSSPLALQIREFDSTGAPFLIPIICCQEILQGARNQNEWNFLEDYLLSQKLIAPKNLYYSHKEAARIYYLCRQKGITIRGSIDCLIAQICMEQNGILVHLDRDFEKIATLFPLKTLTI